MVRRTVLRTLVLAVVAAVALVASTAPATANTGSGAAVTSTGAGIASTGGGCATTYSTRSCISFSGGYTWQLVADANQNTTSGYPSGSKIAIWTYVPGASPEWMIHHYGALFAGYYGPYRRGVYQGGYGWTVVRIIYPNGLTWYEAWSPVINFP
jgi:hypothetical protein